MDATAAGGHAPAGPRFSPPPGGLVPTDEQRAIQSAPQPTVLVQAHAGAAKTTTLALRLAEAWQQGIDPRDCLVLTYTDAACVALRNALRTIGVPVPVAKLFQVATFEAFAGGVLLRMEGAPVPRLHTPEQLRPRVWEAVERMLAQQEDSRWYDALQVPSAGDAAFVADFLEHALWLKGTMQLDRDPPEGLLAPRHAEQYGMEYTALCTFAAYERRIRRGGHPDHPAFRGPGDATYDLARQLMREEEGDADPVPAAWPGRLRVLMVDEMHDMNEAMFRILRRLLRSQRCEFCGVGDVHQVIHAAAGADPAFLGERIADETGRYIATYRLGTSFRFHERLARGAARFTRQKIVSSSAHDTALAVLSHADEDACVAQVMTALRGFGRGAKALGAQAVLLRHEDQSILLENALVDAGLPYRTTGFDSYLLRPEVLLVRGLLTIATRDFDSLRDRDTLARMVESFVFFCGTRLDEDPEQDDQSQPALLATAIRHFHDNSENLPRFLENHVLRTAEPAVARRLRAAIAVVEGVAPGAGPELFDRFLAALDMPWFVAQALVRPERRAAALRNIDGLRHLAARAGSASAFFHQLNATEQRRAAPGREAPLTLAAAAAVKGLEFDHVLLPFLAQGVFPDADARTSDEENLFYVAITRARKALTLLVDARRPSDYVARMGLSLPAA